MVLTVNLVNSALVAIVLASYMGQTRWLIFLALTVALTGARVIGCILYRNHAKMAQSTGEWAMFATIGSGLSGLLWGAGSALLLPDNLVEQTFVAFVIGGMCAASLVSFSYYLPAFIAYVFPASLPLAVRFFLDGWTVHGDMMVVFAAAITLAAYNSTRACADGLRLNCDLTERTRELTAANTQLETEIAQRKVAEDQLHQALKMEAIGQLTGGIAHDFNNLLTAIVGHLEMAESRVGDDPRVIAPLRVALRAAERGATLTRHLLAFARRQHLDPAAVEVPMVVDGVEKILEQTIGPNSTGYRVRSRFTSGMDRSEPTGTGDPEPGLERARRNASWRHAADQCWAPASRNRELAGRPPGWRLCDRVSVGHRHRNESRDDGACLRTVLYDEGGRPRFRPGIVDRPRLCRTIGWIGSHHQFSRPGHTGGFVAATRRMRGD